MLPRAWPVWRVGMACRRGLPAFDGPVVVVGLAGALTERLAAGTVLVPERAAAEDGWEGAFDPGLVAALAAGARRLGFEPLGGTLLTSASIVRGPERERRRRPGLNAVDMESALVLRACPRAATVRVVLDSPERELTWRPSAWPGLLGLAARAPALAARAAAVVRAAGEPDRL